MKSPNFLHQKIFIFRPIKKTLIYEIIWEQSILWKACSCTQSHCSSKVWRGSEQSVALRSCCASSGCLNWVQLPSAPQVLHMLQVKWGFWPIKCSNNTLFNKPGFGPFGRCKVLLIRKIGRNLAAGGKFPRQFPGRQRHELCEPPSFFPLPSSWRMANGCHLTCQVSRLFFSGLWKLQTHSLTR